MYLVWCVCVSFFLFLDFVFLSLCLFVSFVLSVVRYVCMSAVRSFSSVLSLSLPLSLSPSLSLSILRMCLLFNYLFSSIAPSFVFVFLPSLFLYLCIYFVFFISFVRYVMHSFVMCSFRSLFR